MNRRTSLLSFIISVTAILFLSCENELQKRDRLIREAVDKYYHIGEISIQNITYDTIKDQDWCYNLAEWLISNPEFFTDKELYDELCCARKNLKKKESENRIIATIQGTLNNHFSADSIELHIGLLENNRLLPIRKTILNSLLDMCDKPEIQILDIAIAVGVGHNGRPYIDDPFLSSILSKPFNENSNMKYYSIPMLIPYSDSQQYTAIDLQFLGIHLTEPLDTLKLRGNNLTQVFAYKNYCCYSLKNKMLVNNISLPVDILCWTIDNHVAIIKAKCTTPVVIDDLLRMYTVKYGDFKSIYGGVYVEGLVESVSGAKAYEWNFLDNGIIIINNTETHHVYEPQYTYQKPKIINTYYTFENITTIYCDKQLYRRARILQAERDKVIKQQKHLNDSLQMFEVHKADSIQKAIQEKKLNEKAQILSSQI